jgi:hypothetical protein
MIRWDTKTIHWNSRTSHQWGQLLEVVLELDLIM